jgi:glyoxylase-like metal-dependent hydrolase (beta-lactamase superfamily II)
MFAKDLPVPQVVVAHVAVDGEELFALGGLKVIHSPGHSAGHIAFLSGEYGGVLLPEMLPRIRSECATDFV